MHHNKPRSIEQHLQPTWCTIWYVTRAVAATVVVPAAVAMPAAVAVPVAVAVHGIGLQASAALTGRD